METPNIVKTEPVGLSVAIATLINAVIGLLMALGYLAPEVGGAIGTIVTGSLILVRSVVTPVEKVATVLQQPLDTVNDLLGKVQLPVLTEEGHP